MVPTLIPKQRFKVVSLNIYRNASIILLTLTCAGPTWSDFIVNRSSLLANETPKQSPYLRSNVLGFKVVGFTFEISVVRTVFMLAATSRSVTGGYQLQMFASFLWCIKGHPLWATSIDYELEYWSYFSERSIAFFHLRCLLEQVISVIVSVAQLIRL